MTDQSPNLLDDSGNRTLPVDPVRGRAVMFFLGLATIAGLTLIRLLTIYIDRRIEYIGANDAILIICWAMTAVSLGLLPIILYLFTAGKKIRNAGQFPPPDMTVNRDTPIITGNTARRRGLILMTLAVALLFMSAYMFAYAWTIIRTFPR